MKTKSCPKCSPQMKRCDCPTEPSERTALGPSDATACSPSSLTPETDAECASKGGGPLCPCDCVHADFARRLERQRNELFYSAAGMAGDLAELRNAIRNLRDVKGRHHTQQAMESLIALLPENAAAQTPPDSGTKDHE